MNPRALPTASGTPRRGARSARAFTMVELAISIAVVAFALVAILGVLPTGMQVQRDNREETIINQDGNLWLEAIRSGSLGMDDLTNYVDAIILSNQFNTYVFRYEAAGFTNGAQILGLLSTPKYLQTNRNRVIETTVFAYVRALTGSAVEKPDLARNRIANDLAFSYRLTSEVIPFNPVPASETNFHAFGLRDVDRLVRSNQWLRAVNLERNFHEVALTLEWPLIPRAGQITVGGNRKQFRTLVSGAMRATNTSSRLPMQYLFQPSTFILAQ